MHTCKFGLKVITSNEFMTGLDIWSTNSDSGIVRSYLQKAQSLSIKTSMVVLRTYPDSENMMVYLQTTATDSG